MPIAQSDGAPRATRQVRLLTPWLRLGVLLYGGAALIAGYLRLRSEGFSRNGWEHTLTLLYMEALAFLAVFGGAAMLAGLLVARRGERRPRKRRPAKAERPGRNAPDRSRNRGL